MSRGHGALVLLLLQGVLHGCIVGGGEGWVTGDLKLAQCDEKKGLDKKGDFDLNVDFFAGEALEDSNPALGQRVSRLTVRLQNTSSTLEVSDGLMLQFLDTREAARHFTAGRPLPVTAEDLCIGSCPLARDLVRGRLYLYTSCPDARHALVASGRPLTEQTDPFGQSCQVPAPQETGSACPEPSAEARAALELLCQGDFNNRDGAALLRSTLGAGGGACLYLCELGPLQRGQDPAGIEAFAVSYGDRVAALFSLRILDGRAIQSAGCVQALGQLEGQFRFVVQRGLAAQTFP